ncbi:MAG: hypothetical protein K6F07_03260 [Bacilli bacterium]|nr:hypothetical protein [Bacilli bacterium]
MLKSFALLPLLVGGLGFINNAVSPSVDGLVLQSNSRGNYTVIGVEEGLKNASEIRVYYNENKIIDEIDSGAFTSCANLTTLMFSYSITNINDAVFPSNVTTVKYTGSEASYQALGLTKEFLSLSYYACDEGFINYWNDVIRPTKTTSICDLSKETFNVLYSKYILLNNEEKNVVDNTVDKAGAKLGASMQELINLFYKPNNSKTKSEWNQSGAITLIIIISVIGMTSICVFFLLKTKKLID